MLRRNIRLRREYLYRKSLEGKEREIYEKKQKLRKALEEGKPIPTELRLEEQQLSHEIRMEDEATQVPRSHTDDEYQNAGIEDPKIFITTSRNPSSRLIQFAKELSLVFPNARRKNRGNHIVKDIVEACRSSEVTDLLLIHEHRGEPDALIISHLPYGPTAYFGLLNVVLRHDIKEKETMSLQYPHLIFNNFSSSLGERVSNILKYLFPPPKDDSTRTITFSNDNDFISFRHHVFHKVGKQVELKEIGPRFEMRLYQLRLGTVDMDQADNEWVLKPYLNTAKRKQYL